MRFITFATGLVFTGAAAMGCGGLESESDVGSEVAISESAVHHHHDCNAHDLRQAFRHATARYHRVSKAVEDGYGLLLEPGHCFHEEFTEGTGEEFPLGIVYINLSIVDGTIDEDHPEVLYYEPQADGRLKLVGGEYFCPDNICLTAPTLFGFTFRHEVDTQGWALHTWAWLNNPNGLTFPINPNLDTTYCAPEEEEGP